VKEIVTSRCKWDFIGCTMEVDWKKEIVEGEYPIFYVDIFVIKALSIRMIYILDFIIKSWV
jgi:hypothetical protein